MLCIIAVLVISVDSALYLIFAVFYVLLIILHIHAFQVFDFYYDTLTQRVSRSFLTILDISFSALPPSGLGRSAALHHGLL